MQKLPLRRGQVAHSFVALCGTTRNAVDGGLKRGQLFPPTPRRVGAADGQAPFIFTY